jgi:hypothetical protein
VITWNSESSAHFGEARGTTPHKSKQPPKMNQSTTMTFASSPDPTITSAANPTAESKTDKMNEHDHAEWEYCEKDCNAQQEESENDSCSSVDISFLDKWEKTNNRQ